MPSSTFLAFLNQNKGQVHLNRPCLRLWKQDNSASWSFYLVDFINSAKLLLSAYNCFTATFYILVPDVTKIRLCQKKGGKSDQHKISTGERLVGLKHHVEISLPKALNICNFQITMLGIVANIRKNKRKLLALQ